MNWQKWHRILAWVASAQLLVWLITGLLLNLLPADLLDDNRYRAKMELQTHITQLADISPLLARYGNSLQSLELRQHLPFAVYRLQTPSAIVWLRADSLTPLTLSVEAIRQQARMSLKPGSGLRDLLSAPQWLAQPPADIADKPVFAVQAKDTVIYVDPDSGEVIAHRHPGSQLRQWLLMLHFMDYFPANGISFNALPIQLTALLALMMALAGVATMMSKARQGTLILPLGRYRRQFVQLFDAQGQKLSSFPCKGSVLNTLNSTNTRLRTRCGGGGNCGMCRLRWLDTPPKATDADNRTLSDAMLAQGVRLACQHKATSLRLALVTPAQHKYWLSDAQEQADEKVKL
ncbi:2Fe-2S iron-sulfur cluster-binding protein [Shewanella sp. GXUN23E]|uniref:2Fe-2S iron-sulfur cluster-binding protein n=1 Tax=Shewanella sp. GXUN23E TaxID=3422498 RepID=UPI003D7C7436